MVDEPFVAARKRNLKERVSQLELMVENLRSDAESTNLLLKSLANCTSASRYGRCDGPKISRFELERGKNATAP